MPDQTPTPGHDADDIPDDVDVLETAEDIIQQEPLMLLFGDNARVRFLRVLLDAHAPLNPSRIAEQANVDVSTWYEHRDDLEASGLVEQTGTAGNSPLYTLADAEDDKRREWLEKLRDWTNAYRRDGDRPA